MNTEPHAYAVGIGVVRGNEDFSDAYIALGLSLALLRAVALRCCADSHVLQFVAESLEKSANSR